MHLHPTEYDYALVEAVLMSEKSLISAPLEDYTSYISSHDHFRLLLGWENKAIKNRLESAGYEATLLRVDGNDMLFDIHRNPTARTR